MVIDWCTGEGPFQFFLCQIGGFLSFFLAPFPISFTKIILQYEKIDALTYAYRNLSTDLRFVVVGTLPCHFLIMLKYAIIIILILR